MNKNKYLITQSLLSSWQWIYKKDDGYEDFMKTLNREHTPPTQAMLDGQHFEGMVTAYCNGEDIDPAHKWAKGIVGIGDRVKGGAFQVALSEDVVINNVEFVLYGILDVLKCGKIHDIKFSNSYKHGKYLDSPQHPMYFALCPEASEFFYEISNGKDVYRESYRRDDTAPIEDEIKQFMNFLDERELVDLYCLKWKSKY